MRLSFVALCASVVVTTLLVSMLLAPILWSAAGYIENIITLIYNPMENLQ